MKGTHLQISFYTPTIIYNAGSIIIHKFFNTNHITNKDIDNKVHIFAGDLTTMAIPEAALSDVEHIVTDYLKKQEKNESLNENYYTNQDYERDLKNNSKNLEKEADKFLDAAFEESLNEEEFMVKIITRDGKEKIYKAKDLQAAKRKFSELCIRFNNCELLQGDKVLYKQNESLNEEIKKYAF